MIFHISVMLLPWRYDGNSKKEKRKTLDKIIDDFFHAHTSFYHDLIKPHIIVTEYVFIRIFS